MAAYGKCRSIHVGNEQRSGEVQASLFPMMHQGRRSQTSAAYSMVGYVLTTAYLVLWLVDNDYIYWRIALSVIGDFICQRFDLYMMVFSCDFAF